MKNAGIRSIGRFLGHIFCGILIYVLVAGAATLIDNYASFLKDHGASEFTLMTIKYLSHLLMVIDFLMVVFFTIVSTARLCRDIYNGEI